jgi:site-specific DNA-methyltransferase (adenine-specific)
VKLFTNNDTYKIYQGSMLDLLEVIEPNTIDSVVTDPPYELNFMNKGWDRSGIAFQKDTWDKCYQALKPGGYLLAFGGSRTFHRIAVAIEDAGFEIRDVIMWVYGSGFPKSHNVGLTIDKLNGIESKVIGNGKSGSAETHTRTMKSISDKGNEVFGGEYEIKEAQNEWQGWGTALKPAYEPIIVARKPLKGTVAQNVLKYGVGAINIDECRVETDDEMTPRNNKVGQNGVFNASGGYVEPNSLGRFPANFIHDGSDEVVSLFPNSNGGTGETKVYESYDNDIHFNASKSVNRNSYADDGNASRFFYTAKASKKDRDEGLKLFEETDGGSYKFREDGSLDGKIPSRKNIHPTVKPCELMQYLVRMVTPKGGTVMDCFMGSGSTGKATMFENRERQANYKFIGIDLDLDNQYCEIANARIDYALNKFEYDELEIREQDKEKGQLSIFDFMD